MQTVVEIVLPVYGLALLGYGAARLGYFSDRAAEGLAHFVFDFALPFMLLRMFARADLPDQVPWGLLGSFYLPAFALYFSGMALAGPLLSLDSMERVIAGLGCAFGNLALLGLPVALRTFDEQGLIPYFIVLSVHGLLFLTVTTVLLEFGRSRDPSFTQALRRLLVALVRNPFILALAGGLVLNRAGLALPGAIDQIAAYMQQAVAPCALFSLGASLARYRIAGALRGSLAIVCFKNLLLPLSVSYCAMYVFGLGAVWTAVLTLMASQPTGVIIYLFSERYETARELATTTVFLSALVSLGTVPVLLYWFQVRGVIAG